MKKICTLLCSVCFALPLAFLMTACGGGGGSGKQATDITVSVKNTQLEFSGTEIVYDYGETVQLSKSDFTVSVLYADGLSDVLTDEQYVLDTNSLPSATPDAGFYPLNFTYEGHMQSWSVWVRQLTISTPVGTDTVTQIPYTGSEINIVDVLDAKQEEAGLPTLSKLVADGVLTLRSDSTLTATECSTEYTVMYELNPNYELSAYTSLVFSWAITPCELPLPIYSQTNFTYEHEWDEAQSKYVGVAQTLPYVWDTEYVDIAEQIVNVYITAGEAKEVGNYQTIFEISEEHQNNYNFANYGTYYVVDWNIRQMVLPLPELEKTEYVYTEDGEDVVINNFDEEVRRLTTIDGELTTGDVDEYYLLFSIDETKVDSTYYYRWDEPGAGEYTQAIYLYYNVTKATFTAPADFAENVKFYGKYFGGIQYEQKVDTRMIIDGSVNYSLTEFIQYSEDRSRSVNLTAETFEYLWEKSMTPGNYMHASANYYAWADNAKNQAIDFNKAGTYTATLVYYKDLWNYEPCEFDVEITIDKYELQVNEEWEDGEAEATYVYSTYPRFHRFTSYLYEVDDYVTAVDKTLYKKTQDGQQTQLLEDDCTETGYYTRTVELQWKMDTDGVSFGEKFFIYDTDKTQEKMSYQTQWQILPYEFELFVEGMWESNANTLHEFYSDWGLQTFFYNEDLDPIVMKNTNWREYSGYSNLYLESSIITNDTEGANAPKVVTYYKATEDGEYELWTGVCKQIGYYKFQLGFDFISDNFVLLNVPTWELKIVPATVDISAVCWEGPQELLTFTYSPDGHKIQKLINVPDGVANDTRDGVSDAKSYSIEGKLRVPSYVTVTGAEHYTVDTESSTTCTTYIFDEIRHVVVHPKEITQAMLDELLQWRIANSTEFYTQPFVYDGTEKGVSAQENYDAELDGETHRVVASILGCITIYKVDGTTFSATEVGEYQASIYFLTSNNYKFADDCARYNADSGTYNGSYTKNYTLNWSIVAE